MHDVLQELIHDLKTDLYRPTPWASIRNIEVISVLFGREASIRFAGDEITKKGLLPLEFSRLVLGVDPIEDVLLFGLAIHQWQDQCCHPCLLTAIVRTRAGAR